MLDVGLNCYVVYFVLGFCVLVATWKFCICVVIVWYLYVDVTVITF